MDHDVDWCSTPLSTDRISSSRWEPITNKAAKSQAACTARRIVSLSAECQISSAATRASGSAQLLLE